jgi:pimeloyl-ACP methyl ester carboxylesterase
MMTSEPTHYSIILVHGTWARGMFPAQARPISESAHSDEIEHKPASRWFDRGSPFRNQLVEALNRKVLVYSYDIRSFEWSGTNSFAARWRAATGLAADIKKITTENPESRIVCIAHSHGGNVVLHAIEQLQGIDLSDADNKKIDVITLATPFVSVFPNLYSPMPGSHTEARRVYSHKWRLLLFRANPQLCRF